VLHVDLEELLGELGNRWDSGSLLGFLFHLLFAVVRAIEQRRPKLELVLLSATLGLHRRDLLDALCLAVGLLERHVDDPVFMKRARRRVAVLVVPHAHDYFLREARSWAFIPSSSTSRENRIVRPTRLAPGISPRATSSYTVLEFSRRRRATSMTFITCGRPS